MPAALTQVTGKPINAAHTQKNWVSRFSFPEMEKSQVFNQFWVVINIKKHVPVLYKKSDSLYQLLGRYSQVIISFSVWMFEWRGLSEFDAGFFFGLGYIAWGNFSEAVTQVWGIGRLMG